MCYRCELISTFLLQVKPALPVVDMVTQIHGISAESLEGVSFSLRHAQAALLKLCTPDTILVGHALHNDLLVCSGFEGVMFLLFLYVCIRVYFPTTRHLNLSTCEWWTLRCSTAALRAELAH